MTNKEQPEITIKQKESLRKVAQHDLFNTTYSDLATAYLASKTKDFGEYDQNLIEQEVYLPALGKSNPMMVQLLMQSRKDGQRYSGQVDENAIIKSATQHVQSRILALKTDDIVKYLGADKKGLQFKKIKGKYVGDLDEGTQQKLIQIYNTYMVQSKLAAAMGTQIQGLGKHGLETILGGDSLTKGAQ